MSETRPHTGPTILGSVLGSYRILGEISSGGMGTVFRAEHVLLGRPAAVKLLRSDLTTSAELVQRFVNEAKAVTACKHPGIVEVYDFGYTPDARAFIVMELLEGEPLGHRLARVRLTEPEVAAIAHGIASALRAAHKVGVIHRDLKPDNVFLVPDPDGGPDRPKVLDFGIAKLADRSPTGVRHTQTGALIGTPLYMAPEQARAASAIDHRADLYSLGCIIYHMLVGRPPFVAAGGGEIIALQMFGEVEPPSRLAQVSPEMERLVLRLLEKDPADRFASGGDVARALAAIDPRPTRTDSAAADPDRGAPNRGALDPAAPEPIALPPGRDARPAVAPRKRSAIRIAAGAITLIAVGVGLAVMLRSQGAPAEPGPAQSAPSPAPSPTAAAAPPEPAVALDKPAAAPAGAPDTATSSPPRAPEPRQPAGKPTQRARPVAANKPGPSGTAPAGASTRSGEPGLPDKAIEVIIRDGHDEPKPGEHTRDGSPMESDVSFGKKPSNPSSAPPSAPPKGATPP